MSGDEPRPPDFAMARAVEILAEIYERQRRLAEVPPPPLDKVVTLFNEQIALDVTKTTRVQVERALGIAFSYPSRGWHTYCVRGAEGTREFLSLFYSGTELISAEIYLPRVERAPPLEPRNLRFRFVPSETVIGMQLAALPEGYARIHAPELGVYNDIFEARFPGGAAYAMGNKGVIERLALYALREKASPETSL